MIIGDGATLEYSTNLLTPSWTDIDVEILVEIELPKITTEDIEGPRLASDFNETRKSKPGGDDGSLTVEWDSSNAFIILVNNTWLDGAPPTVLWRLTDEVGGTLQWKGSIGGFTPPTFASGERAEVEIPLNIQSRYTIAAPPAPG